MSNTELQEAIRVAQQVFDEYLAEVLEGMADRIVGQPSNEKFQTGDNRDEFAGSNNNA
jgi:hypothetical protein